MEQKPRKTKGPHKLNRLSAVALPKLPDGAHADGGGLHLLVRGTSRSWVFRYTAPDGVRRNMGLGSIESVSLAQARAHAAALRAKVKDPMAPTDPLDARRAARAAAAVEKARRMTFKQCALACFEALRPGWKNPKHGAQWISTLETYAFPTLGALPVADVDTPLVTACLQPIWTTKTETASRVRGRIEAVLSWAAANNLRQGENPARWRGHLDKLLAKPSQVSAVEHHAALPYREVAGFMQALSEVSGMGARALEFAILTAARSGEVRGATWAEIDFERGLWTIPGRRMKARREHVVPLSDAALRVLAALPRLDGETLVFPASRPGKTLSDQTMTAVLRRMGRADLTQHGFRSTFRDWAGETTAYPREAIEHALAHQLKDKSEAAYARGSLLEKRARLMSDWAKHCASVQAVVGGVTPIRGAA